VAHCAPQNGPLKNINGEHRVCITIAQSQVHFSQLNNDRACHQWPCSHWILFLSGQFGRNRPNLIGRVLVQIPGHYPGVELDVVRVMPNDLHGIIVVREVGAAPRGRPNPWLENGRKTQVGLRIASPHRHNGFTIPGDGRAQGPSPTTLSDVIERFKSLANRSEITDRRSQQN